MADPKTQEEYDAEIDAIKRALEIMRRSDLSYNGYSRNRASIAEKSMLNAAHTYSSEVPDVVGPSTENEYNEEMSSIRKYMGMDDPKRTKAYENSAASPKISRYWVPWSQLHSRRNDKSQKEINDEIERAARRQAIMDGQKKRNGY